MNEDLVGTANAVDTHTGDLGATIYAASSGTGDLGGKKKPQARRGSTPPWVTKKKI